MLDGIIEKVIAGLIVSGITGTIGYLLGDRNGFRRGNKHSLLKFLDIYEGDLDAALSKNQSSMPGHVFSRATAIVENVKIWRELEQEIKRQELLNGQIDALEKAIKNGDHFEVAHLLRVLKDMFPGRRHAIETLLRRREV